MLCLARSLGNMTLFVPIMFINALVKALVAPPGLIIAMLLTSLLVRKSNPDLFRKGIWASLAALYLFSMPLFTVWLSERVVGVEPINASALNSVQAIVVLGSGRDRDEPSWGGDTLNRDGLQRNRYAAHLQRQTGLPLYTTGGKLATEALSEAEIMRDVIEQEWGAKVAGVEIESKTTRENALLMACMLQAKGVDLNNYPIALVTSADHIVRSVYSFEQAGFKVVAAPTGYYRPKYADRARWWLPSAEALRANSRHVVDLVGLFSYKRASWSNQCNG